MASPKNPLSYPICGVAATEEHSGVNCDDLLRAALASLQLPHMPINENLNSDEKRDDYVQATPLHSHSTPTVCILVVADVDLSSASALAEYALQQKRFGVFDASMIDLCIACGPFCRDDDLNEYRKGSLSNLSSKSSRRRKTPFQWRFENQELKSLNSDVDYSAGNDQDRSCDWTRTPFFRSNEENAALGEYSWKTCLLYTSCETDESITQLTPLSIRYRRNIDSHIIAAGKHRLPPSFLSWLLGSADDFFSSCHQPSSAQIPFQTV